MTPKQIDLITNGMSGVVGMLGLGLMFNAIDFKTAIIVGFVANVVTSFFTGKGVPSVQAVIAEIQSQSQTEPRRSDRPQPEL